MSRIYFIAALFAAAVCFYGCRPGTGSAAAEVSVGTTCSHDHSADGSHSHNDSSHAHEGHDHPSETEGAQAGHDHGPEAVASHDHGPSCSHGGIANRVDEQDLIFFTPEGLIAGEFEVGQVLPEGFASVLKATGSILPAQGAQRTVTAPVAGIVSLGRTSLSPGSTVSSGQQLFAISTKSVGGGDISVRLKAALDKASADLRRAETLLEENIMTLREYEEARLAYVEALTEYEAVSDKVTPGGITVSSPISGFIASMVVQEGDYVEAGQVMATVTQNRRLRLQADISQRYFDRIANIRTANFTTPYDGISYSLADMNGTLVSAGQSASASDPLIPVIFEFDNNGRIIPGSYVEVMLLGDMVDRVIAVPVAALIEQQGVFYVFVEYSADHYFKQQVVPGESDGMRVRIVSGLRAGQRVVTRGAIHLKLASASGEIPHGHEH